MERKFLAYILVGISVTVIVLSLVFSGSKDNTGPQIEFGDTCVTVFTDNDGLQELLLGVRAIDKKDGDVTSSLRVQNVIVLKEEQKIIVHYSAKDSQNNVSMAERTIDYTGEKEYLAFSYIDEDDFYSSNENASSEEEAVDNTEDTSEKSQNSENNSETPESETPENSQEESASQDTTEETSPVNNETEDTPIDKAEVDRTGIPQIRMKYHTLEVSTGGSFYFMDALAEWYDDKDDVSRRVIIDGTYDLNTPGTYKLIYYVTDSDRNVSNKEELTIIVK